MRVNARCLPGAWVDRSTVAIVKGRRDWRRAVVSSLALVAAALTFGTPRVLAGVAGFDPEKSAVAAPDGPVAHAGRWMVDRKGRVVIVHGVNVPTKWLPAYPAALEFKEDDAALLAESGFNAVRLTVERYVVEPKPGRFDPGYVARFADTVALLHRYGIMSLIDFHQDSYGPVFFDNGFPEWMTMTDGVPNVYHVGFPLQDFLNPALNRAFDHFWANDIGPSGRRLWDDDARILSYVAARLAGRGGLLGYEVMNEPWPGTRYPTCTNPAGCPDFDRGAYSDYHAKVIAAVRAADPVNMIWYEPLTTFNQGVPTAVEPPDDPRLGFSFHDYPLCAVADDITNAAGGPSPGVASSCTTPQVMDNARAHSAATGSALLQTEFGATMDTARLLPQLAEYDAAMMPWMFWSYTRYITAYNGDETALEPATHGNVNHEMLTTLARPYPQLVSGTPLRWGFDPDTKRFDLQYSRKRADGRGAFLPGGQTAISVPKLQYPKGYTAKVGGGKVVSKPNAPVLRVSAGHGAGPITVTVTPAVA